METNISALKTQMVRYCSDNAKTTTTDYVQVLKTN
jgi:hypothetical protein